MLTQLLAHGALGAWDEVIFVGIALVFVVMMGISWFKSRNAEPIWEENQTPADAAMPDAPDRFKLD